MPHYNRPNNLFINTVITVYNQISGIHNSSRGCNLNFRYYFSYSVHGFPYYTDISLDKLPIHPVGTQHFETSSPQSRFLINFIYCY